MRILFVENHAVFAKTVSKAFLAAHDVVVVSTLAQARRHLRDSFDVLLVDYDLDDGKGDELVAELTIASSRPRIIAVSARPDRNQALLEAGADAVCGKLRFGSIQRVLDSVSAG